MQVRFIILFLILASVGKLLELANLKPQGKIQIWSKWSCTKHASDRRPQAICSTNKENITICHWICIQNTAILWITYLENRAWKNFMATWNDRLKGWPSGIDQGNYAKFGSRVYELMPLMLKLLQIMCSRYF